MGVDLLDLDGGQGSEDGGSPDRDAADTDADVMDASAEGGALEASVSPDGSALVDAAERDASDVDAGSDASVDAGSDASVDAGSDARVDAGPQPCDFSGTWATKVELAVTWSGNIGVNSGSGTAYVWTRHEEMPNGSIVSNTMVGCGVSLPGFSLTGAAGGGTGRVSFDVPLFDASPPQVTTQPVQQVNGAGFPGDTTSLSPTAMVLGATLGDPLNGAWPTAAQLVSDDMDGDGKPGVTLLHLNGGGYVYLPVAPFGTARSEAGYYASRVVLSASGAVVSCQETTGQAQVSRFDSRIMGCRRVGGAECSSGQADLLESFRPDHVPGTATFRAIKVANNASCASIRSSLP